MKEMFFKTNLFILCLLSSTSLWAGTVTINNGASLKGTGNIIGDVVVNTGGAVAPWPTCLSVNNASFSAGSELQVSIEGNQPCTNHSQLIVNGEIDLNDATLNATTNNYTMQVWDEYVFIDNDDSETILSPFDAIGENSTYTIDGELLYASYFAGDGNDFSLLFKFIYPIGGTVSGLAAGNEVFLQDGGGEIVSINSNGSYQFPTGLDDGSSYNVTVINQPSTPNQTCTVANGSGTVSGGAVTDINVTCVTNSYPVGGTVVGLAAGNEVVVLNNASEGQVLNSNGGFVFSTSITDETAYSVTISANPSSPNQTCDVINGMGTVAGDAVTDVVINCVTNTYTIGGNISGLAAGNAVVLQNSLADDLVVNTDGSFTFDTAVIDEGAYAVTVLTQPDTPNQTCTVAQGSGSVAGVPVTTVEVACVINTYSVGGTITGLTQGGQVTLQNNMADDLMVSADGGFVFTTALNDETPFDVQVTANPSSPNQTCSVSNNTGTLAGNDVDDVVVNCVTNSYTISGQVSGLVTGNSTVLQLNLANDLNINANGVFIFDAEVTDGESYEVTVLTQPNTPNQLCAVTLGSGTITGEPITDVLITCDIETYFIGGDVAGLAANNSVTLQNNLADDLLISSNGVFVFDTPIDDKSAFDVSVLTQPTSPNQTCDVSNGSGNVTGDDVVDVTVDCVVNTYTIGGVVSGLLPGEIVELQNNLGDDLMVFSNGAFSFNTELDDLSDYDVTILSEPTSPIQQCEISGAQGQVNGENVTSILIACDNLDLIFKNGFEQDIMN